MSPKKRFSVVTAVTALFVIATVGIAWGDLATGQSISINGGAASTTSLSVTVTVAVVHCPPGGDLKALEVAFRNSTSDPWMVVHAAGTDWPGADKDGCTGETPTSPTTDFAWTLASGGSGPRTVYARFKHGNDEVFAQDDIEFTAPPTDSTPPVITPTVSGTLGLNGWYTSDVTVSWTVTDPESSITLTSGCDTTTITTDTPGTTLTCTATSAGGTSSESVTIKRDATPPSVSVALDRSPATSGWFNASTGAPVAQFTCSDATSGLASCPADYTFGEGADQSHTGTAYDIAGNSASATVSEVDVDLTPPTLTWSDGPADGSSYYFGFVPAEPTCTAADALSGPAGCTVTGYESTVGSHTMTATAYDVAGNSSSELRTYTVLAWTLYGFYRPVDMPNPEIVLNTVKAGSTVPLKFEIFAGPTELTDPAYVASFKQAKIECNGTAPEDEIEVTTTGGTSLRYDPVAGQFIQNWQTPKLPGQCYRVTLTTDDGSSLVAYFKLK